MAKKERVQAQNASQTSFLDAFYNAENKVIFATGPAGTGKTYVALSAAVEAVQYGEFDRIVLVRPLVDAGESLGYLPGDVAEKIHHYMLPLYDVLHDRLGKQEAENWLREGKAELSPLAYMRGRTFNNAVVVLDEAQNATAEQMKMILTRIGIESVMVISGDPKQVDLPAGVQSGLTHAVQTVAGIPGIVHIDFPRSQIVRSDIVAKIVAAYEDGPLFSE